MKTTLGGAACALLLVASAHAAGDGAPPKCRVNVYVNPEGHVVVDNEPVHPKGCKDGNAVTWQLRAARYTFDAKGGIAFDKGKAPASARCQALANGKSFVCRFAAEERGAFNYSIHVQGPGGAKSVDPTVILD